MGTEERDELARQQEALLRAVLAGDEAPPGFDEHRLRAQAEALHRKRRRIISSLRPDVVEDLGDRFDDVFARYAETHPRTSGTAARADADAFADWAGETRESRRFRIDLRWLPLGGRSPRKR